jgi:hypothetical protein
MSRNKFLAVHNLPSLALTWVFSRDRLEGLLPPAVEPIELQAERCILGVHMHLHTD